MEGEVIEGNDNYYSMRSVLLGGKRTGCTTFWSQIIYGSPNPGPIVKNDKDYYRIGGKLRVSLDLHDKPADFSNVTNTFFDKSALIFLFFDLSRPKTFFHDQVVRDNDNVHV